MRGRRLTVVTTELGARGSRTTWSAVTMSMLLGHELAAEISQVRALEPDDRGPLAEGHSARPLQHEGGPLECCMSDGTSLASGTEGPYSRRSSRTTGDTRPTQGLHRRTSMRKGDGRRRSFERPRRRLCSQQGQQRWSLTSGATVVRRIVNGSFERREVCRVTSLFGQRAAAARGGIGALRGPECRVAGRVGANNLWVAKIQIRVISD
jgi:hypothetical protein